MTPIAESVPGTTRRRESDAARPIALAILAGFDRHYGLFRYNAQQAKARFEAGDWHGIRKLARERITFYDQRVSEAVQRIEEEFRASELADGNWQQVKRHYVTLLAEHKQPELAETFFNSVCCKILHRT
jgi:isocitrate dehydrogenase kinase/phosphatase